jgi:hypothetical protein
MEAENDLSSQMKAELAKWRPEQAATLSLALKHIKPKAAQLAACRDDLETALIDLGYFNNLGPQEFKPAKLAAKSLTTALLRVEAVLKQHRTHLDARIRLFVPSEDEFHKWRLVSEKSAAASQFDFAARRRL